MPYFERALKLFCHRAEMLEVVLEDGNRILLSDEEKEQYSALRRCNGSVNVKLTLVQWEALQREIASPTQISGQWCDTLASAYVVNHKELLRKMLPRIGDYFGTEPQNEAKARSKLGALQDE